MQLRLVKDNLPSIFHFSLYLFFICGFNLVSIKQTFTNFSHWEDFQTGRISEYSPYQDDNPRYNDCIVKLNVNNKTTTVSIPSSEEINIGDVVKIRYLSQSVSKILELNGKELEVGHTFWDYISPVFPIIFCFCNWIFFIKPFFRDCFEWVY